MSAAVEAGAAVSGDREELLAAGYVAVVQLQAVLDAGIEDVVRRVELLTGERLLVRPGVLDATYDDLAAMARQTEHYAEAWRLIRQWLHAKDTRSLGSVLKVLPAGVAHEITDRLRAAGVLPADGPQRSL